MGLSFRFLLGLGVFLLLLFGFCNLLVVFPLQILLLRLGLGDRLEKSFQSGLLCCLDIFLQLLGRTPDTVLIKPFLVDQELNESFNIGCLPFEVALGMISWPDIWVEEQFSGILVRPVFGKAVPLFRVLFDEIDHTLQGSMLSDELQCGVRANFWNGVDVVATEKDAKINELLSCQLRADPFETKAVPEFCPCPDLATLYPGESLEWVPSFAR